MEEDGLIKDLVAHPGFQEDMPSLYFGSVAVTYT